MFPLLKSICLHAAQNAFDYGHIFAVGHTPELTSHQTQPCRIGNEKEAVHLIGPLGLRLQSDDRAERSARTGPIHGLSSAGSYLMCSDKDVSVCLWGWAFFSFFFKHSVSLSKSTAGSDFKF